MEDDIQIVLLWGTGHHQSLDSVLIRLFLICDAVLGLLQLHYWPSKSGEEHTEGQAHSKCRSGDIPEVPGHNPVLWALTWPCWSRRLDQVITVIPSNLTHFCWNQLNTRFSVGSTFFSFWCKITPLHAVTSLAEKILHGLCLYVLLSVIHGHVPVLKWLQHAADEISDLLSWIVYTWSMGAKRGENITMANCSW